MTTIPDSPWTLQQTTEELLRLAGRDRLSREKQHRMLTHLEAAPAASILTLIEGCERESFLLESDRRADARVVQATRDAIAHLLPRLPEAERAGCARAALAHAQALDREAAFAPSLVPYLRLATLAQTPPSPRVSRRRV